MALIAQVKPSVKKSKANVVQKKNIKPAINTTAEKDTIRIMMPPENGFNPSNSKLKNSKIKTPVYDGKLTGTNAPGDANTGIPSTPNKIPAPTPAERVQAAKDSIKN